MKKIYLLVCLTFLSTITFCQSFTGPTTATSGSTITLTAVGEANGPTGNTPYYYFSQIDGLEAANTLTYQGNLPPNPSQYVQVTFGSVTHYFTSSLPSSPTKFTVNLTNTYTSPITVTFRIACHYNYQGGANNLDIEYTVTIAAGTTITPPPSGIVYFNGAQPQGTLISMASENLNTIIPVSPDVNHPVLTSGQSLYSADGSIQLILQTDGNLVIYQVSTHKALWSSKTNGTQAKNLYFQGDGNLVLTNSTNLTSPIWASDIYATSGDLSSAKNCVFALQNDGNFAMFINSIYSYRSNPGYYTLLGDTGTGNLTVSSHSGKIE